MAVAVRSRRGKRGNGMVDDKCVSEDGGRRYSSKSMVRIWVNSGVRVCVGNRVTGTVVSVVSKGRAGDVLDPRGWRVELVILI